MSHDVTDMNIHTYNYNRWSIIQINQNPCKFIFLGHTYKQRHNGIYMLNIDTKQFTQILPYPDQWNPNDVNLAFQPETNELYILQRDDKYTSSFTHLYKVNIITGKWKLLHDNNSNENHTRIYSPSYACCMYFKENKLFIVTPNLIESPHQPLWRATTLQLFWYLFDENKMKFIKQNNTKSQQYINEIPGSCRIIMENKMNLKSLYDSALIVSKSEIKQLSFYDDNIKRIFKSNKPIKFFNGIISLRDNYLLSFYFSCSYTENSPVDIFIINTSSSNPSMRKKSMTMTNKMRKNLFRSKYDESFTPILIENRDEEKLIVEAYVNAIFNKNEIKAVIPITTISIITKYYCREKILLMYNVEKPLVWAEMTTDDILNQNDNDLTYPSFLTPINYYYQSYY